MNKVLLFLIVFTFGTLKGFCQLQSFCVPSDTLRKLYIDDAKILALQRMHDLRVPDTALIEIPQRYADTVLGAIAAVRNLGKQYEADSIFLNYCVHQWNSRGSYSIAVSIDLNYGWTEEWTKGNTTTGYAALDQFLSLHHVYLKYYQDFAQQAILASTTAINMTAFCDSLRKFPGVLDYGWGGIVVSDGDRIDYKADSDAHLAFSAGWGDCPLGCTSRKIWNYTIHLNDCSVQLDSIILWYPEWSLRRLRNCNLIPTEIVESKPTLPAIFPNPADDFIYLKNDDLRELRYEIRDIRGRKISEGTILNQRISTKEFEPGIYIMTLFDHISSRYLPTKFLKE